MMFFHKSEITSLRCECPDSDSFFTIVRRQERVLLDETIESCCALTIVASLFDFAAQSRALPFCHSVPEETRDY